jgi:hypothetical protein
LLRAAGDDIAPLARRTASTRSPSMTREFAHAEVSVSERVATSFGTALIRAENGSLTRPGRR